MSFWNRKRGYNFEHNLASSFDDNENGWYGRRLGGASSGLPDIIITGNMVSVLYSMECKSVTAKSLEDKNGRIAYIPQQQIQRCYSMLDMFGIYDVKYVVFAFKFNIKKPKSATFHFHKVLEMKNVKTVTCYRDGTLTHTKLEKNKESILNTEYFSSWEDLKVSDLPLEEED